MQAANANSIENAFEEYTNALETFNVTIGRLSDVNERFKLPENLPARHLTILSKCLLVSARDSIGEDDFTSSGIEEIQNLSSILLLGSTILGAALADANIIHGKNQVDAYNEVVDELR